MEEITSELDIMEAAFGSDFKRLESCAEFERFCIHINVPTVTSTALLQIIIQLPQQFPQQPLSSTVDGILSNATIHEVNKQINRRIEDYPEIRSMEIVQFVQDVVSELSEHTATERRKEAIKIPDQLTIARFLIYFHHIMSTTKRKVIVDTARELRLSGVSKTGFPGIVIVEGALEDVLEYVRRIQRLRWQQMVVRGEETEIITLSPAVETEHQCLDGQPKQRTTTGGAQASHYDTIRRTVDAHRKIQGEFYEIYCAAEGGNGGMSAVGSFCKETGLHELFMTAMKKYST